MVALCADEAQHITGQVFLVQGGAVNALRGWQSGQLFFSESGWGPAELLDELLKRFPAGVQPAGMVEGMQRAGGRSMRTMGDG